MSAKSDTLKAFQLLQLQQSALLENLNKYSALQLNASIQTNQWSIAQVIDHLALSETISKKYLDKKIANKNHLIDIGIMSNLRRSAINLLLRLPIKYKVPIAAIEPKLNSNYDAAVSDWHSIRSHYSRDLDLLDESLFSKDLFLNPLVGKMTLSDAFQVMYRHTAHHQEQINRITNHLSFRVNSN